VRRTPTTCATGADCLLVFADDDIGKAAEAEAKKPEELTEDDKMAILGKPKLGEVIRAQIRIKESKEFKVSFQFTVISKCIIVFSLILYF
jgi:hypothetical protein